MIKTKNLKSRKWKWADYFLAYLVIFWAYVSVATLTGYEVFSTTDTGDKIFISITFFVVFIQCIIDLVSRFKVK